MHGILPCGQDFAFSLVELYAVPISLYLQLVQVPLEGSTALWHVSHCFLVCVTSKLAEGTVFPVTQITDEDFRQNPILALGMHC